ncbi:MAG TPA: HD-GYP domain-containing protein [Chloroflexota bacterium]|nr:HD-GYP domain-containing protein [Chloroflexota bacterium]
METARLIAVAITAGTLGILLRSTRPLRQAGQAEVTDSQSLVKAALHRVNIALEDRLDQRTILELIARSALEITSGWACRLSLLDGPTLVVGQAGVYWREADDDAPSELPPAMAASLSESITARMTGLGDELGTLEVWAWRNMPFAPAQEESLSYFASEVAAAVKNVMMVTATLSHASAVESKILEMSLWQRQLNEYCDDLARTHEELTQTRSVLEETYMATLEALAGAVDARDPYTYGHCKRVAEIASSLALQMGLPDMDRSSLELAALLHDIGKIGVPDNVLRKVTPLSQEDAAAIHQHPEMGYRMLSALRFLGGGLAAVRYHHERFDGSGYPYALSGDQIPLLARVLAVADAFDAITSDRPYRRARSRDQGVEEVRRCAGSQFDPSVVEAFVAFMNTAA